MESNVVGNNLDGIYKRINVEWSDSDNMNR